MYEVELKVRADHDDVRDRLEGSGADAAGRVLQEDTYYDAPHREFAETDEALRIRRERRLSDDVDETTARVTYKGALLEAASKSREEFETGVADGETVAEILKRLGFEAAETVRKEREVFDFGEYTVTLDDVDGLGEFVEVETETETEDIEDARDGARELLTDLDLDPDEQIRTSYLELLLADDSSAR